MSLAVGFALDVTELPVGEGLPTLGAYEALWVPAFAQGLPGGAGEQDPMVGFLN